MFKQAITDIFNILNSVQSIRWIDEDYGQIDSYEGDRPPVAFPCALVSFSIVADHLGGDEYDYNNAVTIRVAHNRMGDRSAKAPEEAIAKTLAKLDDVTEVKNAMIEAGYYFVSMVPERRVDGIAVHALTFTKIN